MHPDLDGMDSCAPADADGAVRGAPGDVPAGLRASVPGLRSGRGGRAWLRVGLVATALASCAPRPSAPSAGLAALPGAAGERFLDQGWSAADRATFVTTSQGSQVMPLAWFAALRRTDVDAPFAGDQLLRYGYLPSPGGLASGAGVTPLPVGFVPDDGGGEAQLGITCAACHTGQLRIAGVDWRIDGGRASADFQAFLTDLGATAQASLDDPGRFAVFAAALLGPAAIPAQVSALRVRFADWTRRYTDFMSASLPDPAWCPGRLDAFGMIFNRVTGLDLKHPGNIARADAPVRYPFIWDAPRQDHTQWTGAAPNGTYLRGLARNTGEVFGVFGVLDPVPVPVRTAIYRNSVNLPGLQTLEEKVVALRPPAWPRDLLPLDAARVSRGAALFGAQCSGCHGARPSSLVEQAWATTVQDVGTDRRAFDNAALTASPAMLRGVRQLLLVGDRLAEPSPKLSILANVVIGSLLDGALLRDAGIRRAIGQDIAEGRRLVAAADAGPAPTSAAANVQAATVKLYRAVDGVPGAAYEARVLTGIWAVGPYLHNGSVPSLWELLKLASQRVATFAVGHHDFDPVHVGLQVEPGLGRTMFVVDPGVGNGNDGHEYGTALPEAHRWALLEYLKTL